MRTFAAMPYLWVAMGGGGYSLDAVRRTWALEFLIMLGASVPDELRDADPPAWTGAERKAIDDLTDVAIREALGAAW